MADKRISQLNSHTSPSGSDLLVIVNNNETKKITYADLSAALTGSQTDISALNQFTQSIDGRVDNLESWSSSLDSTFATDLQVSIVSSSVAATIGVISQNTGLVSTSSFNSFTQSIDGRVTDIENLTSSFERKGSGIVSSSAQLPNGIVSGSSQLTSSYDNRYVLSGSITQTTWDNISGKPDGLVSQSVSLSSLNSFTASYFTDSSSFDSRVLTEKGRIDAILSASTANADTFAEIVTLINSVDTTNDNAFATYYTSSNARISSLENATSSYETTGRGILSGSFYATTGSNTFTDDQNFGEFNLNFDGGNIQTSFSGIQLKSTTFSRLNYDNISYVKVDVDGAHIDVDGIEWKFRNDSSILFPDSTIQTTAFTGIPNGTISGSSQLTSSLDLRYATSASYLTSLNGAFSSSIQTLGGSGVYSSSAQLPNGLISGSSQLTASYDTRYTLSGSVQPLPAGLISGSSQLTASYDTRYALSGSSVNINTGSLATTGSNTFIGTETISGSLLLSGSFSYNGTPLQNGFAFAQPQLTRILDNASYTGSSAWITSYNGNGGAIIVTANVSGYRTTGGLGTAQLLRDGVAVASQTFYFNIANYHTPLPPIVYVRNSETGSHTYSIYFSNILADTNDYATINVLEYGNSAMFPTTIISGSSQLTSSFDTRYAPSASYLTSLNGALSSSSQVLGGSGIYSSSAQLPSGLISGSSQLTASYDTRYTLSGSGGSIPNGTISGSSQLTSSFDLRYSLSGSSISINTGSLATTGSNTFNGSQTITGSLIVSSVAVVNGGITIPTGSLLSFTTGSSIFVDSSGAITGSLTGSVFGIGDVSAFSSSVNSRILAITSSISAGTISGSSQLTSSFDTRYTLSGSVGATPIGTISGSSQLTSSLDLRYAPSASYLTSLNGAFSSSIQILGGSGVYSSSAQLPSGLVSGSSQLTASYDTRYTLSGSVISGTTPAGTISGSSQLTSSFDGRYVQTGSFNTLTASFNSFTASAQSVTTGSNSFNGTQTITGSLIIATGSFIGSQITANTASLYLTSGSNMYVQNNGVVEITGSLKVSGSANFNVSVLSVDGRSGDEGGEINLAIPATNTTLENRVTTDVWQNRYRIFEGSANAKGVFVDLSKAPAGVGGELTWKASGLVNTGVDVTLGDLKARIPSTGNKSLQLSTTTGVTYSVYGSSIYSQGGSVIGLTINATSPLSVSTTPVYLASGNNFGTAGATDTWVIMDTSNTIAWRITMILGAGFNNNMISIERLV